MLAPGYGFQGDKRKKQRWQDGGENVRREAGWWGTLPQVPGDSRRSEVLRNLVPPGVSWHAVLRAGPLCQVRTNAFHLSCFCLNLMTACSLLRLNASCSHFCTFAHGLLQLPTRTSPPLIIQPPGFNHLLAHTSLISKHLLYAKHCFRKQG